MFEFLYNKPIGKYEIIRTSVEDESGKYLERIYKLDNSFFLAFYEECINSIIADAYEYFIELKTSGNVFRENIYSLTKEKGRRFIKLMAIHHTVKILKSGKCSVKYESMKKAITYAFGLSQPEQKMLELLYACATMYSANFNELFSAAVMKYLFNSENVTRIQSAFIGNFCFNSYSAMFSSFTRYLSLEQRMKGAV